MNPSNWTATGYATIAVNGVQFPTQRQVLNFPAGTVVADDPVNAMTDITPAGGVSVQQDGTALPSNPYSTMNFTGAGVSASDVGGIATVNIRGYALPLYLTFAQSGTSIACSGSTQLVFLDQSGGAGTYSLPVSPMDGHTIVVKDNGNIASPGSQGGSWGNSPPTLTVTGGVYIEDPNNSGTYSATAATAIPQNGGSWTLVYSAQDKTWFTC